MGDPNYSNYSADNITVLEGIQAVRMRPAMYIGDTGKKGLHHLIFEIVDNSIDESMAGFCDKIEVVLNKDGSVTVSDNGRGIPVEKHRVGKSALEVVTTMLHAGGKFDKKVYKASGGLHGVGISVVNALSEFMIAKVKRNGKIYVQKYERGKPITPVEIIGESNDTGTEIRFKPDPEIFGNYTFDYTYIRDRLMELAFLNKGITITLSDMREDAEKEVFHYEGGISSFVEFLNKNKQPFHPVVYISKEMSDVFIECAFQYTNAYRGNIYSFVNNIRTVEGGTHLIGFRAALTRAINDYIKRNNMLKGDHKVVGEDVVEGITSVVSIRIPNPQFEGQTKTKLGNTEIKGIVDSAVYDAIKRYFEENPHYAKSICIHVIRAMNAREAAQKARDLIRRKSVFENTVLPGKLADCISPDSKKTELFIVEGESAGGSSKQARDRNFQAVLPIKGKILNVEKAPITKILNNEEIKNLIASIGAGFGENFDINKTRYGKIIIMTDADVDGAHIRTLLLTLFYRYFRQLIEEGRVYIAQPPLYRIKKGKIIRYAFSDEEKEEIIKELMSGNGGKADGSGNDNTGINIQRYKGLGEMNPQQLWETTMDPNTRILKQVTIEDAMRADMIFTVLMGDDVHARREFIQKYAKEVKNLDI